MDELGLPPFGLLMVSLMIFVGVVGAAIVGLF
jgi:hypothetical protein